MRFCKVVVQNVAQNVAPLYQRWSFHAAGFLAWDPVLQAVSLVDERDERDLVDPVDSETSQVGFFGE